MNKLTAKAKHNTERGDIMKAFTDKNRCIGCGICVSVCPVVFAMGDDGKAVPVMSDVPEGSMDNARNAEESCPTDAVMLEY